MLDTIFSNYTNVLSLIAAALLIWTGIGILIAVKKLNDSYELAPNKFLYPANCKPSQCKDPVGFIAFITPRLILFAVLMLILSAFLILSVTTLLSWMPEWISQYGAYLLFFPLFIWYVVFINQAAKRFW